MKLIVKGAAAAALMASLSANAEPPEVSYADADGRVQVITRYTDKNGADVVSVQLLSDHPLTFELESRNGFPPVTFKPTITSVEAYQRWINAVVKDVDGDGDADIVVADASVDGRILLENKDGDLIASVYSDVRQFASN